MLELTVQPQEHYNQETNEFINIDGRALQFEHSLLALSKWESIIEKPFLAETSKTQEEMYRYFHFMLLTPDVPLEFLNHLSSTNLDDLNRYITSNQTATTFPEEYGVPGSKKQAKVITAEIIYHWMFSYRIPIECQEWHLNRLLATIRVCGIQNSKPKKMTKAEIAARNHALNEKRKAELGTKG